MARLTTVNDIAIKFTQTASITEDQIILDFQVVDSRGAPASGRFPLKVWFTSNATTLIETASTYSGAVAATQGTLVKEVTAKKNYDAVTNADGLLRITIIASATPADFAVVHAYDLNPRVFVSPAFTAYGEA
jgi:hypothetical protein